MAVDSFASGARIVLAGRPGAGKRVQGARLARRLGVRYVATGDLLRDEMAAGSELGGAVERLVAAGRSGAHHAHRRDSSRRISTVRATSSTASPGPSTKPRRCWPEPPWRRPSRSRSSYRRVSRSAAW